MIELLVLDVDGCMTDGKITYDTNGIETKSFNVKDGLAIATWIRMGKQVAIITGRSSTIVQKRADELKIQHLYQGIKNKKSKLDEILKKSKLTYQNVASIGDDLNDYHMLKASALSFTPKDGAKFIKDMVDVVLNKDGGDGAIRQMIEYILEKENIKQRFLQEWV